MRYEGTDVAVMVIAEISAEIHAEILAEIHAEISAEIFAEISAEVIAEIFAEILTEVIADAPRRRWSARRLATTRPPLSMAIRVNSGSSSRGDA